MLIDTAMFSGKKPHTYANTWTQIASLPIALYYHEFVTMTNGSVLSIGGAWQFSDLACTANCYRYDPGLNSWTQVASLPIAHCQGASVKLSNDSILTIGGFFDTTNITANCYRYDPGANNWTAVTALPAQRQMGWADLMANGSVIYYNSANVTNYTTTTYLRDTAGNWTTGNAYPIAFNQSAGCPLSNGCHMTIAGTNGASPGPGLSANCYFYSEATGTWSTFLPAFPHPYCLGMAAQLDDKSILHVGGIANTSVTSANVYRWMPDTNTWYHVANYPPGAGVAGAGIAKLTNGSVIVGGGGNTAGFYSTVYRYD